MIRRALVVSLTWTCLACGSDPIRRDDAGDGGSGRARGGSSGTGGDPGGSGGTTGGSSGTSSRPADEVAEAIGEGDGSPESVSLLPVFEPEVVRWPTGLAFHPSADDELWVTLTELPVDAPCTSMIGDGCNALEGKMAIIEGASTDEPAAEVAIDGNGWHFLRRPMGLAFGAPPSRAEPRQFLATCGEARTANYTDEEIPYNGPVLWDADRALFGARPGPGMNGTHVDMLHDTPYCMGIAHERENVYWVFNGDVGALDRYDFNAPHEPGGDDHSDGEVWRYAEGELARVPGVPSHLVFDASRGLVYVADSGNGRVVALDPSVAAEDGEIVDYDRLPTHARMSGASVSEIVPPGLLEVPSGLTLVEDVLFVTDHATSRIVAVQLDGTVVRELDTGLPANSLAAIAVGPDGKAYITELERGRVLRIEP